MCALRKDLEALRGWRCWVGRGDCFPTITCARWAPAFFPSQRGGHLFGTGVGGVIVNFECGDELANNPLTDFQLVVREGFSC